MKLLCFTLLSALTLWGQERILPAPLPLHIRSETLALNIPPGLTMAVSGKDGFFVRYSSQIQDEDSVHFISNDGQRNVSFAFSQIHRTDAQRSMSFDIADLAPMPEGGVALLGVWSRKDQSDAEYTIEQFDRTGTYTSSIPLTLKGNPVHLASFRQGFVIQYGVSHDDGFGSEGIVLLDNLGKVFKQTQIDDINSSHVPIQNQASPLSNATSNSPSWNLWESVASSTLISGEDGSVYLVRRDLKGTNFRITSTGTIQRLQLVEPAMEAGYRAVVAGCVESAGALTIEFLIVGEHTDMNGPVHHKSILLSSYGIHGSGSILRSYVISDDRVSPLMIDADGGDFHFLSFAPDPTTGVRRRTIVTLSP